MLRPRAPLVFLHDLDETVEFCADDREKETGSLRFFCKKLLWRALFCLFWLRGFRLFAHESHWINATAFVSAA